MHLAWSALLCAYVVCHGFWQCRSSSGCCRLLSSGTFFAPEEIDFCNMDSHRIDVERIFTSKSNEISPLVSYVKGVTNEKSPVDETSARNFLCVFNINGPIYDLELEGGMHN